MSSITYLNKKKKKNIEGHSLVEQPGILHIHSYTVIYRIPSRMQFCKIIFSRRNFRKNATAHKKREPIDENFSSIRKELPINDSPDFEISEAQKITRRCKVKN